MRHLCLAQCDNEVVIRDQLSVGESGELLFYPPMENKVPVGWKYTIRPPIPKNEYTGNLVSKTCRHKGDQRDFVTSPFPRPDIATLSQLKSKMRHEMESPSERIYIEMRRRRYVLRWAIRAYPTNTEIRDLRRDEQQQIFELSPDEVPKPAVGPGPETDPPVTEEMQDTQACSKFMIDLRKNPQTWNSTARTYANKKILHLEKAAILACVQWVDL